MQNRLRPLPQALCNGGMAVAQTVNGDAAHKVQILVAVLVEDIGAFAPLHGDGHTDMVAVQILVTGLDDLRVGFVELNHDGSLLVVI
ncbi:hypothetical protein SDC9_124846 [bioreactor metagenome]|uniref:Uncharacterized protein n=1 Tax=bioreactor metagenome TaxID=1076179 RepID=A0A645CLQ1_9ZZZZ